MAWACTIYTTSSVTHSSGLVSDSAYSDLLCLRLGPSSNLLSLGVLCLVNDNFGLVRIVLVDVNLHLGTIDRHQDEGWVALRGEGRVSASQRTRIKEELSVDNSRFGDVGVARDEDIDIQLALKCGKRVLVSPRHNLVTMTQTDSEVSNLDHFALVQVSEGLTGILIALDNRHTGGQCTQILLNRLGTDVTRAQDVLHLTQSEQLLELRGNLGLACGHVDVAEHQNQLDLSESITQADPY